MARYRGTLQGGRGETSRLGTPNSGLVARADGWKMGGKVEAYPVSKGSNHDSFRFVYTGGSNAEIMPGVVAEAFTMPFIDGKVHRFIRFPECFGGKTYVLMPGDGSIEGRQDRWEVVNCSWKA